MPARTSSATPELHRKLIVAGGVVLLHVGALWGLQSGLLHHPAAVFVPVEIVTEIITPPVVRPAPPPARPQPPPPPPPPRPIRAAEPPRHVPAHHAPPPPARKLAAAPELPPAANAPTGRAEPQAAPPPATAAVAATPAPAPAPAAPSAPAPAPATARVQLPVSDADYLHNPKPVYPPTSRRLGEQGKVVLRVLIGVDGTAQDATVLESSGFARLDRAALEAARQWRYVPGKRGGVPEPMWVKVPIDFDLSE